jgi:hypothetical protein
MVGAVCAQCREALPAHPPTASVAQKMPIAISNRAQPLNFEVDREFKRITPEADNGRTAKMVTDDRLAV